MKFVKREYSGIKEILKTRGFESIGVTVDDTDIVANSEGMKIVPAGTVVGGKTKSTLANEDEMVVEKNTQGAVTGATGAGVDAEGVLLHDVDVTHGPTPASMVIRGNIDLNKITAPCADAQSALKSRILFIK